MESNADMFIALCASRIGVGAQFDGLVRDENLKAALHLKAALQWQEFAPFHAASEPQDKGMGPTLV
jgi:hypothetical protein